MNASEVWEVEVRSQEAAGDPRAAELRARIEEIGATVPSVEVTDLYFFTGPDLTRSGLQEISERILSNRVTQDFTLRGPDQRGGPDQQSVESRSSGGTSATVLKKPGVMDPVEASLVQALADLGVRGVGVATGARFDLGRELAAEERRLLAEKVLSNPVIEDVYWHGDSQSGGGVGECSPFSQARPYRFVYGEVPLAGLDDDALLTLSKERQLSLTLLEMQTVRDHFAARGRAPSDVEMETIAQTWSEHCCHKTLTGLIEHRVVEAEGLTERTQVFQNLLKETIVRATEEIDAPWCLSVFVDNAGAIAFDDEDAVTFKVETHNHPSAIEPYGGAGTGIGGVLRDTLGTGLGAKPIVNTDVFCFGPPDMAVDDVPPGALHPMRVLRGVVGGVRDYGNRMGIPTASGAVCFDARYTGNPLVFCGSVGMLPRRALDKDVQPGDLVYVLGGRTGRDGIHGATFSSQELSEESETVSSGAVQIGNAITEKRVLDVLLQARNRGLFRGLTDCGAGGLSSAVGEMGEDTGARVALEKVPLKYEGLSYWEIWISEAQERMVLAVPGEHAAALETLCESEDVECTAIGEFTDTGRLELSYEGENVCDLEMRFLHKGRPRFTQRSVFERPMHPSPNWEPPKDLGATLRAVLASPNVASKEGIIRQYDHEVQGASVLKPLQGVEEDGPGDGVAFAPKDGSRRGVVVGCGINPLYGDLDPYRMAMSAVDEAVRNVVAAGGDPTRTAILDNFCWGNTERPETLGSLVEAARGCYRAAVTLGTPFISGKDSLNNDYRVGDQVVSIPPTLLISSISITDDIYRLVSMDLKAPDNTLVMVGETRDEMGGSHFFSVLGVEGGVVPDLPHEARALHQAVAHVIERGLALSCHDLSEGGLAVAVAEMAFSGQVGAEVHLEKLPHEGVTRDDVLLFSESNGRYLLEVRREDLEALGEVLADVPHAAIGETISYKILRVVGSDGQPLVAEALEDLKCSWKEPLTKCWVS